MQSYIWKDPNLTPQTISDLPLQRYFRDIGYVIWRAGWGDDDLVFLFKSGRSLGHAHNDQNSFSIWKDGYMVSGGPGYATSWQEYDQTFSHNCILIDPEKHHDAGYTGGDRATASCRL